MAYLKSDPSQTRPIGRPYAGKTADKAKSPSREEFNNALSMINSIPGFESLPDNEKETRAFKIASIAKEIMRKTGVNFFEAAQQAFDQTMEDVTPGEKTSWFDLKLDKAPQFNPAVGGSSIQTGNEPTATNPQTGEKLIFRNGQWQPIR